MPPLAPLSRRSWPALAGGAFLIAASLLASSAPAAVASPAAADSVRAGVPQAAPTTVILVRHAEKAAAPANDPALSPEGEARARALAEALEGSGVQAIVTTQFTRTKATAAPLAAKLGLTPEVVPAAPDVAAHARQIAELVTGKHAGHTVLVVGHSNTIPAIVRALGGSTAGVEMLPDHVYDRLYVVVHEGQVARTVQARYGAPTP